MPTPHPIEAMEDGDELRVEDDGTVTVADGSGSSETGTKMKPNRWA